MTMSKYDGLTLQPKMENGYHAFFQPNASMPHCPVASAGLERQCAQSHASRS